MRLLSSNWFSNFNLRHYTTPRRPELRAPVLPFHRHRVLTSGGHRRRHVVARARPSEAQRFREASTGAGVFRRIRVFRYGGVHYAVRETSPPAPGPVDWFDTVHFRLVSV